MTDGGEEPEKPQRDARDEPLGDVAERVRERTGERRGSGGERRDAEPSRREGPLADVATEVDERRRRETSDPFESVDVGDLDGEKLWERLAAGESEATASLSAAEAVPVEASVAGEGETDAEVGRDVRTIPKATCHGCPHLGDPPELHCTHEDTDILAMSDADHFRVADCPMVVSGEEDIGSIVGEGDDDSGTDGAVE